jgi:hypothetical protein
MSMVSEMPKLWANRLLACSLVKPLSISLLEMVVKGVTTEASALAIRGVVCANPVAVLMPPMATI